MHSLATPPLTSSLPSSPVQAIPPSPSPTPPPPSPTPAQRKRIAAKEASIYTAIAERDYSALARLAKSKDGLLSDTIRKSAWPLLLGFDGSQTTRAEEDAALAPHLDEAQVKLDVDRSFANYPSPISPAELVAHRAALTHVIVTVLRRHPGLAYYQGFHDIAQVSYLVLGASLAVEVLERLALDRLRDFMMPSIQPSLDHLALIPILLARVDRPVASALVPVSPNYALAAVLTLFAHEFDKCDDITLLFDFLLACPDMSIPLYIYAVILIARRDEVLGLLDYTSDDDDYDEKSAMDAQMLEAILSRFPQPMPISLSDAMSRALALRTQHPPETLVPAWKAVSTYSVLRTLHKPDLSGLPPPSPQPQRIPARWKEHSRRQRRLSVAEYAEISSGFVASSSGDSGSSSSDDSDGYSSHSEYYDAAENVSFFPPPPPLAANGSVILNEDEYDYIDLQEFSRQHEADAVSPSLSIPAVITSTAISKPVDYSSYYAQMDALVTQQVSECEVLTARAKKQARARAEKQQKVREAKAKASRRRAATASAAATALRRLGSLPILNRLSSGGSTTALPGGVNNNGSEKLLDESMVLLNKNAVLSDMASSAGSSPSYVISTTTISSTTSVGKPTGPPTPAQRLARLSPLNLLLAPLAGQQHNPTVNGAGALVLHPAHAMAALSVSFCIGIMSIWLAWFWRRDF
ncbi:rab-GTPase-TBC domain-containing protein [Limtongia smithiae]|uniref:rab-GTPase-TBC domain-containing protein n=1 Tax=Limtongia smithiae TaxID=1125753 RepID=UPI0034CF7FE9